MTRLLSSERQMAFLHFFHDVLVADLRANQIDTELLERELEADVAHHRGYHLVAAQTVFSLHLPRAHQHHVIAVEHAPVSVDQNRAVAVPIERDTQSVTALPDDVSEFFRMRRPYAFIDVAAVGLRAKYGEVEAKLGEECWRDGGHRAVGAIDRHSHATELLQVGQHGARML